jgi:hypothetical protein
MFKEVAPAVNFESIPHLDGRVAAHPAPEARHAAGFQTVRAAVGPGGSCQGVPPLVRARVSFNDLRGRFDEDRAHHDACIAASGCDGAGARLRFIKRDGDAKPTPRPPSIYEAPRPLEVPPEVDETIFIEGPRDVGHHYNLLPQFAAVLTTNVTEKTSHRLFNLIK